MLITCFMCGSGSFQTICDELRIKMGDEKPSAWGSDALKANL